MHQRGDLQQDLWGTTEYATRDGCLNQEGRNAESAGLVFVNNRSEGTIPLTVQALTYRV
mgnify:CR=1 FL=1